jgi:hypothetical protein
MYPPPQMKVSDRERTRERHVRKAGREEEREKEKLIEILQERQVSKETYKMLTETYKMKPIQGQCVIGALCE